MTHLMRKSSWLLFHSRKVHWAFHAKNTALLMKERGVRKRRAGRLMWGEGSWGWGRESRVRLSRVGQGMVGEGNTKGLKCNTSQYLARCRFLNIATHKSAWMRERKKRVNLYGIFLIYRLASRPVSLPPYPRYLIHFISGYERTGCDSAG